ncbi:hypothetical protein OG373_36520 [Streptomyces avidinii]|uniref:hypothetical protein n=1 Tax=Streptomyces avidinii TaxID=1895 RepID=UPI00386C74A3|nr:hypothetical protein OG373_36520 [Streptomyces avidinii]
MSQRARTSLNGSRSAGEAQASGPAVPAVPSGVALRTARAYDAATVDGSVLGMAASQCRARPVVNRPRGRGVNEVAARVNDRARRGP